MDGVEWIQLAHASPAGCTQYHQWAAWEQLVFILITSSYVLRSLTLPALLRQQVQRLLQLCCHRCLGSCGRLCSCLCPGCTLSFCLEGCYAPCQTLHKAGSNWHTDGVLLCKIVTTTLTASPWVNQQWGMQTVKYFFLHLSTGCCKAGSWACLKDVGSNSQRLRLCQS
jgi:hypothetical protein